MTIAVFSPSEFLKLFSQGEGYQKNFAFYIQTAPVIKRAQNCKNVFSGSDTPHSPITP